MMRLKRTRQCDKCPWKVSTNPCEIPNGYSLDKHQALINTIAQSPLASLTSNDIHIMGCHEHDSDAGVPCVGWLVNQLGPGNNLGLRMMMLKCTNVDKLTTIGDQHPTFLDTLP